jgi:hypothetical protein
MQMMILLSFRPIFHPADLGFVIGENRFSVSIPTCEVVAFTRTGQDDGQMAAIRRI